MRLSERLFLLAVIFFTIISCESKRKQRNFLMLLGYMQGYNIGQDYAPILILPPANQQGLIIHGVDYDKYQDISNSLRNAIPKRKPNTTIVKENEEGLQIIFPSPITPATTTEKIFNCSDKNVLKKNDFNNNAQDLYPKISTQINVEMIKTTELNPYPLPSVINEVKESSNITAILGDLKLPPIIDNRWHNFTLKGNLSDLLDGNNMTIMSDRSNSTVKPPSEMVNDSMAVNVTSSKGPYPNALYNNSVIDQLSITTNSYTNEESPWNPPKDDRWGSFNEINKESYIKLGGFKPLAGLYYDGFLHRPLKKYDIVV